MPRIELIPMHPQPGAVIQLRPTIPFASQQKAPPPAALRHPSQPRTTAADSSGCAAPAAPVEAAAPAVATAPSRLRTIAARAVD